MEEKKMQYLFGMHPVLEAVKAGKKFEKVLLKQGLEGVQFRELMELLKVNEIPFQFVPGERLNRQSVVHTRAYLRTFHRSTTLILSNL